MTPPPSPAAPTGALTGNVHTTMVRVVRSSPERRERPRGNASGPIDVVEDTLPSRQPQSTRGLMGAVIRLGLLFQSTPGTSM
jgi:hypothetical protein